MGPVGGGAVSMMGGAIRLRAAAGLAAAAAAAAAEIRTVDVGLGARYRLLLNSRLSPSKHDRRRASLGLAIERYSHSCNRNLNS